MFLNEFTECNIQFENGIFTIDGKRYVNRGDHVVQEVDLAERVVYFSKPTSKNRWFDDGVPFAEVDLIPLFHDKERGY
jgi:hypothetical protein